MRLYCLLSVCLPSLPAVCLLCVLYHETYVMCL